MNAKTLAGDTAGAAMIEDLERARRRILILVVITSLLWILPQILEGAAAGRWPSGLRIFLLAAGIVGAGASMIFMLQYHRFQARLHADPELRRRLDDERVLQLRGEAIVRGWGVLVVLLGLGVAVAPFAELPDQPVLLTLLLVAVDAPLIAYLILDRD